MLLEAHRIEPNPGQLEALERRAPRQLKGESALAIFPELSEKVRLGDFFGIGGYIRENGLLSVDRH